MLTNWEKYRKLLKEKVDDAKHNLDLYEKKYKEAKVIYDIAIRGREAFEQELDKKMDELEMLGNESSRTRPKWRIF